MAKDSRLVSGSIGSFLLPPTHPGHIWSIETDLRRKKDNRGSMSLEYAAEECNFIDADTKQEAINLINKWKSDRLPLSSPEVQKWINDCVRHLGNTDREYTYIRKYYPEFQGITV